MSVIELLGVQYEKAANTQNHLDCTNGMTAESDSKSSIDIAGT